MVWIKEEGGWVREVEEDSVGESDGSGVRERTGMEFGNFAISPFFLYLCVCSLIAKEGYRDC